MNKIIYLIIIILSLNISTYSEVFYNLNVSIFPEKKVIKGKVEISSDTKQNVKIEFNGFKISGIDKRSYYTVSPDRILSFSFEKKIDNASEENVINDKVVYLIDRWYPRINTLSVYSFSVNLPADFTAVSEADYIKEKFSKKMKTVSFFFPYPAESIHLIASKNFSVKEKFFDGIRIKTYLFKEDKQLSDLYMKKVIEYIDFYQKLIGKFPYKSFSIVENIFPTGYSMPTFTLIGKQIIKYPFILKKSLPHEIFHQWFGCSVYVDYTKGNWSEGLTTYLSDHLLDKNRNIYRKNLILKYMAFVNRENEYPLRNFLYKKNKVDEAIGYGKSAMFFHYLKFTLGDKDFFEGIKNFYLKHRFKKASWEDIKTSLERSSGKNLSKTFDTWLNKKGIFSLSVKNVTSYINTDGFFKTKIKIEKESDIAVPAVINSYNKKYKFLLKKNVETLKTEDIPLTVVIDRDYNIFRKLTDEEIQPVIYFFLGDKKPVLFYEKDSVYKPVFDMFPEGSLFKADDFKYSSVKGKNVIVLGKKNPVLKKLIGKVIKENGTFIKGMKNPFSENKSIFVVNADSKENLLLLLRKIRHYGNYTCVSLEKRASINNGIEGINITLNEPAVVISKKGFISFNTLLDKLTDKQIIYIGEQHTNFSHHAIQYQIIKALYNKGKKIAIGMEMFSREFQKYIDLYIKGKISEEEMLQKTQYFNQWKYDYNLYKPIIRFAKKHNIPLIGLNINVKIVEKVARKGIDSLSNEDMKKIPESINFSNFDYKRYLLKIFSIHSSKALKNFDYFYQSQVLWDETMAETLANYISKYRDKTIVVLAGNGHLVFGYGIPDRVKRGVNVKQTVVLNGEKPEEGKANYFILSEHIKGKKSKKLGVYVKETEKGLKVDSVVKTSVAEKAGVKKGDIIVAFNKRRIKNLSDLKILLISPPEKSSITVLRKDKEITLTVNFSEKSKH